MIALLQRVTEAQVKVDEHVIGQIGPGLLVLLGVEKNDTEQQANRLLEKILAYRVFSDENDKMNLSLQDINGGLLIVPQFTLAADTTRGLRPSFTPAAAPEQGNSLFNYLCSNAKRSLSKTAFGQFGTDMQVSLTNDGPVTFWLQVN